MSDDPEDHARRMLESLGLDPEGDDELAETPGRFTEFLGEFFAATDDEPPDLSTFRAEYTGGGDAEPVVLAGLPFYSMCIHHLVPFFGTVDVAYVPGEAMTGFGSVGRVVDHFAHRPQLQERFTDQIAGLLDERLSPEGLLVRSTARQMCMEMRGAEKTGRTVATASRGSLADGARRRDLLETFRTARGDR